MYNNYRLEMLISYYKLLEIDKENINKDESYLILNKLKSFEIKYIKYFDFFYPIEKKLVSIKHPDLLPWCINIQNNIYRYYDNKNLLWEIHKKNEKPCTYDYWLINFYYDKLNYKLNNMISIRKNQIINLGILLAFKYFEN